MSFDSNLKDCREASNLTIGQLAEKSGVSQTSIARFEAGLRPSKPSIEKLSGALRVALKATAVRAQRALTALESGLLNT